MKNQFYFLIIVLFFTPNILTQDNALTFDGVNDYASLGSTSGLEMYGSFTIELWVKMPARS